MVSTDINNTLKPRIELSPGRIVSIHGLVNNPQYNTLTGILIDFHVDTGRWIVRLRETCIRVNCKNITATDRFAKPNAKITHRWICISRASRGCKFKIDDIDCTLTAGNDEHKIFVMENFAMYGMCEYFYNTMYDNDENIHIKYETLCIENKFEKAMKLLEQNPAFLIWHMMMTIGQFHWSIVEYLPFKNRYPDIYNTIGVIV
jgi:hypothetical protein